MLRMALLYLILPQLALVTISFASGAARRFKLRKTHWCCRALTWLAMAGCGIGGINAGAVLIRAHVFPASFLCAITACIFALSMMLASEILGEWLAPLIWERASRFYRRFAA